MTFQQFLLILWARRKAAIAVFALTVMTALVVSLILPKRYEATATLVLDVKSPDPISGIVLPGLMAPGYMATQVDIINSDRVAQKVVSLLKLDANPVIQEQWQNDTNGKGSIVVWLANLLQNSLEIKPSRDSSVIQVKFTGADPDFAAAVANGFAKAYMDTTIDLRVEPAKQYANWFEGQINAQRTRLDEAQNALTAYQQETGIVATDNRLDYEVQKFNELSSQLILAQAQGTDSISKQQQANADTLPEVMQNPLINQLKADLVRLESRLKELSGNLGENHPQYKRSLAELGELKAKIKSETEKIAASISTVGRVSEAKASEIKAAIEAQKQLVFELKGQKDKINLLVRDVETAQRAYDAISQRYNQSNLEAESVQTNVSVLTAATAPLRHSKPKVFLNVIVAIFLGGILAISLALILELMQPKIRSAQDLVSSFDIPMLGQLDAALLATGSMRAPKAAKRRKVSSPVAREA